MDALKAWGANGIIYCQGEQSAKLNYIIISQQDKQLLLSLLKYVFQRINARSISKFQRLSILNMLFWKLLLTKTLHLGCLQSMIFKQRVVFHTSTARNPLEPGPWQSPTSRVSVLFQPACAILGSRRIPRCQNLTILTWIPGVLAQYIVTVGNHLWKYAKMLGCQVLKVYNTL